MEPSYRNFICNGQGFTRQRSKASMLVPWEVCQGKQQPPQVAFLTQIDVKRPGTPKFKKYLNFRIPSQLNQGFSITLLKQLSASANNPLLCCAIRAPNFTKSLQHVLFGIRQHSIWNKAAFTISHIAIGMENWSQISNFCQEHSLSNVSSIHSKELHFSVPCPKPEDWSFGPVLMLMQWRKRYYAWFGNPRMLTAENAEVAQ